MKLFYLSFLIFSINAFSDDNFFNRRVPNRDYTVRDLILQRAITRQLLNQNKKPEAKGVGIEFMSAVTIKTETKSENGQNITTKKYYVYNRNCGSIQIPEKEGIDKLKNGQSIKYKFKGMNNCSVEDWRVW